MVTEMAEGSYCTGYAATGRAKCHHAACADKTIAKGTLVIGRMIKNHFVTDEDELRTIYYHVDCIFEAMSRMRKNTKRIETILDIEGYKTLRDDDRDLIERKVAAQSQEPKKKRKRQE